MTEEERLYDTAALERRFTAHTVTKTQLDRLQMVREAALEFARIVVATAPRQAPVNTTYGTVVAYLTADETGTALDKIEEAVFWANAAIARSR